MGRQQGHPVALLVTLLLCCWCVQRAAPAPAPAPAAPAPAADPLKRRLVPSLTDELKQQLKQHGVGILLVLPGSQEPSKVNISWEQVSQGVQKVEFLQSFADFTTHLHNHGSRNPPAALHHVRGLRGLRLLAHSSSSSSRRSLRRWGLHLLQVGLRGPIINGEGPPKQQQQQQQPGENVATAQPGNSSSSSTPPAPQPAELPQQKQQQPSMQQQPSSPHPPRPQQNLPRVRVALLTLGQQGAVSAKQSSLEAAISRRLRNAVVMTLAHSTHSDKPETLVAFDAEGSSIAVAVQQSSVFRDAFSQIYDKKVWGEHGGGSGVGSSNQYTANVRQHLTDILTRFNITSMLDSSCGSMHWMPLVLEEQEKKKKKKKFRFTGTDVVCSLIEQHKKKFARKHPNWSFQCVDYSAQPLPVGHELVFSRDSLQHIPMHGAWQFLNNVRASGAKWLLVGSYVTSAEPNKDIGAGGYYPIDLLKPPFNVSQPVEVIDEKVADGKHLLLFEVAKMTWSDPLQGLA